MNKVTLLGNVGKAPRIQTINGQAVCNLSLATTERWRDKNGTPQEKTSWHQVVAWGATAENLAQYVEAGDTILVEGKIVYGEPKDLAGSSYKVQEAKINILTWQGLGRREKREERRPPRQQASAQASAPREEYERDDDIPF